ncbi:MAG: type II secretion system secretin GspD [Chromatiales bacterium]|nr:type II secretion system secretin GspD [Chromatiales bacterium]
MTPKQNRPLAYLLAGLLCWALAAPLQAEGLTLNLKDAEIGAVIATVSEMTGRNFIVDPRVKGKVTVIASQPMAADELYQVFLAILNVHGFAAIPGENVTKIVPEAGAKQDAIPTVGANSREGEQLVTRVLHVNNVTAAQLVPILRPLLPQGAHLAAYTPSNVLIVSASDLNVRRIADLVSRIDLTNESDSEIIPLRHASSAEVERILSALNQGSAQQGAGAEEQVRIIADNRTNSVILSGGKSARQQMKKIIERLDTPLQSAGNTRVIYLNYAKADSLAQVLSGIGQSIVEEKSAAKGETAQAARSGKLNIQADVSTNALVISAPPDVLRDLEAVIRQLDVRRAQVMVRAVIAEVSTDISTELGVQWAFDSSNGTGPVGFIDFNNTLGGIASAAAGLSAPPSLAGITLAGGRINGDFRFGALLRALRGDANNNILATPSLVTMDNEEAEIVVGQNVPFVTGSFSSVGGAATPQNPFQTIQRQDVGLTLKIKPQINEGDAIRMEIQQEVSSLSAGATGASDLITNKRSVRTTVMVDDGKVLVLGGLIDEKQIESSQRVPLLGDIPILGQLFRHQKSSNVKQDLMIFLHPRILRDELGSSTLSSGKYNYIRARQLENAERSRGLLSVGNSPLLPDIDNFLELPPPYVEEGELPRPPAMKPGPDSLHGQ